MAGRLFTKKFGLKLTEAGVKFNCAVFPEGIKDVNEYYVQGGSLNELVASSVDGLKTIDEIIRSQNDEKELKAFYSVRGPAENAVAEEIMTHHTLKYIDNVGFYEYRKGVWDLISDMRVKNYVASELGYFSNSSRVAAVCNLLKAVAYDESEFNRENIMNFKNGILNLDDMTFSPHSHEYLSSIQMNYDYDEKAECPEWEKFIYEVMHGDKKKMALLQEAALCF